MARYLYLSDQHTTESSEQFPEHSRDVWIDIPYREHDQIESIVKRIYTPHPAIINRILDGDRHQPSLLVQEDAVVFILSDYSGDLDHITPHHLGVFLGKHFLVTVHLGATSKAVDPAWEFVQTNQMLDEGVDFALYEVLYHHVRRFTTIYVEAVKRFESLHDILLECPSKNLASQIVTLRKDAMHLRKMIHPEQEIYALLKSADVPYIATRNRPYFDDVASRAAELSSDVDSIRDGLSGMVEAYTSMQSNEINKIMKFLTIVSVLSLPATTIASIYGMNFYIPELHWHYGYWYSLVVMLLITLLLLIYMNRRQWLR